MTIDGFLPFAAIIGGAIVGAILIYTVFYSLHMKALGKYGIWWAWPLLAFYAVCAVISLGCAALAYWQRTAPHYGFFGDDRYVHEYAHAGDRPVYSFALLFLLSCLAFISVRHAVATIRSTKTKS